MLQQFGAAGAFEEREPQQQVHVRYQAEGMLGELYGQPARRLRHDHRTTFRRTLSLQEIADKV